MADHTSQYKLDYDCNYLDPEKSNSSDFLLSCINKPDVKNPLHYNNCLNASINIQEGFSNDHSSNGPGVSYTPLNSCHDGYSLDKNGECNIQFIRGRERDGDWQRGHHSEIMHSGKKNYQICGNDKFLGLSNGYMLCSKKENDGGEEEVKVTPYTIENFATF